MGGSIATGITAAKMHPKMAVAKAGPSSPRNTSATCEEWDTLATRAVATESTRQAHSVSSLKEFPSTQLVKEIVSYLLCPDSQFNCVREREREREREESEGEGEGNREKGAGRGGREECVCVCV